MIEIRIHGRGGQGGVTLAKLIATSRFLLGDSVQAFGIYAAERSGAPLQAFCRYDQEPIANRNQVYEPDHVIVLDPTLIGNNITSGLALGGWILINSTKSLQEFVDAFPGYRIAVIDATAIARKNKLGTRSVPIVNTALCGAFARMIGMTIEQVHAALEHMGFVGANLTASQEAFEQVEMADAPKEGGEFEKPAIPTERVKGLIDGNVGMFPQIRTGQWATEQPDRHEFVPPCNHVCPAGNDVQGFLHALAKDDPDEALRILHNTTPFPGICGRVCPAPCMEACNRIQLDEGVNVRQLERYAGRQRQACPGSKLGDHEQTHRDHRLRPRRPLRGLRSGASSATRSPCTRAGPELGGLLRTGIPVYRLPRDVLDKEINQHPRARCRGRSSTRRSIAKTCSRSSGRARRGDGRHRPPGTAGAATG
jgi:2-oxoacid:acceptor oxidoreductase gamma subunit (pyruvate/2-ketoisovalerate family)